MVITNVQTFSHAFAKYCIQYYYNSGQCFGVFSMVLGAMPLNTAGKWYVILIISVFQSVCVALFPQ